MFNNQDCGMSWDPPWVLVQVHHTEVLFAFSTKSSPVGVAEKEAGNEKRLGKPSSSRNR